MQDFFFIFRDEILPELARNNIILYQGEQPIIEMHRAFIRNYFYDEIFPFLQPVLILKDDISSFLRDNRLYLVIKLYKKSNAELCYALIKIPFSKVPRFISLPSIGETHYLMFIDDAIGYNLDIVFPGFIVDSYYSIRISRDADFSIDPHRNYDLVKEIQKSVKKRKTGRANRMVYNHRMPADMLQYLCETYHIPESQCIPAGRYLTLEDLIKLPNPGSPSLSSRTFSPMRVALFDRSGSMFKVIKNQDILLHYPYQSFDYLIRFLTEAAYDPKVDEIKITQYRVAEESAVVNALITAAKNGKRVTVFVELKARFDEENNIIWAKKLEKAGCHVIYGLVGLKTHSKITLVVRREEDGIRRYVHLGTGNYNDSTAKLYTDCGLLTCAEPIGEDATAVFNMLSGYSEPKHWNDLIVAPIWLRKRFLRLIEREKNWALAGKEAHIIAKMNSLCDREIIEALYAASAAGVKIELIIRGICCLKVGIPHISENISVRSIVGNFLEHARIFYFYNDGAEELYMGSADWMPRNLDKRVEIVFPLKDEKIKQQAKHILDIQLADNLKAHILQPDGSYEKIDKRGKKTLICAQDYFCEEAVKNAKQPTDPVLDHVFIPAEAGVFSDRD